MAVKLSAEAAASRHQTSLLFSPDLSRTTTRRLAAGVAGGVVLPLVLAGTTFANGHTTWLGGIGITLALILIVGGELLERSLFFTAASPPR